MKIEINECEFDSLYKKAREGFNRCINNKENGYILEEIDVPIELVTFVDSSIKIVFSLKDIENYILEICIMLHVSSEMVGKYVYYEDDKGTQIDDSLVFY